MEQKLIFKTTLMVSSSPSADAAPLCLGRSYEELILVFVILLIAGNSSCPNGSLGYMVYDVTISQRTFSMDFDYRVWRRCCCLNTRAEVVRKQDKTRPEQEEGQRDQKKDLVRAGAGILKQSSSTRRGNIVKRVMFAMPECNLRVF